MKLIIRLSVVCVLFLISCKESEKQVVENIKPKQVMGTENQNTSIYQFKVKDIAGNVFDLNTLKGKKIMVVNTASECGLTPQYELLEKVYEEYKDSNFTIIGFPANNFGAQEPGTNTQIATFCQKNYGVTFPMMGKISVKGEDIAPIYKFLTEKSENGVESSEVKWNFQKYLINENGTLAKVIAPTTLPDDSEIISWIKG